MEILNDRDIEQTGRIIALTRQIESRMSALGAEGTGLREKSESLGDRLPPESARLLAFIGSIRNRVAHEEDAVVSREEFALFEEAVQVVLEELGEPAPKTKPKPAKPAKPPAEEKEEGGEKVEKAGKVEKTKEPAPAPAAPPPEPTALEKWLEPMLANASLLTMGRIPALHLLYAGKMMLDAAMPCLLVVLLAGFELAALFAIGYGLYSGIGWLAAVGAGVWFLTWLGGIYDGRFLAEEKLSWALLLIPGGNLAGFFLRFLAELEWGRFFAGAGILFAWIGALVLLCRGEFAAAGVVGFLSYLGSFIDTFLHHPGDAETADP